MNPSSLFSLSDHLERLSKDGDPLEVLSATVDFEYFRQWLVEGLGYGDGSKGGRPPFDPVSMFKVLILQAQHNLSDAKMEFPPLGTCAANTCRAMDPGPVVVAAFFGL
jgi:hypothetical protein